MKITSIALAGLLLVPATAAAANKEHQQIMAELRMLQEQQAQLQQMLGSLADTLKVMTTRIDEQSGSTRKAFADQKLIVEGVGETVRILREKADDTNVRLSSMRQELESMRQAIAAQTQAVQPVAAPVGDPDAPATPTSPGMPPSGMPSVPVGVSPQKMYDAAYNDYVGGHYDLAVLGFETYIKTFPRSDMADDAQLNIGNALYSAGKNREAIEAFQKVIADYPQSNSVPAAYYKLGQSYEANKQIELARKAYDTLIQNFPNNLSDVALARQALERLNRR